MALSKRIALGNGVQVNYHRVARVDAVTNVQVAVEVASYTSRAKREEERAALEAGEGMDVYVETSVFAAPYDPAMTVAAAYSWLKTLPMFEGASDVLEEGQGAGGEVTR